VDTRFREKLLLTKSSDCTIQLNYTLQQVRSMRLHEIEIPNSWYTLSSKVGNNTLCVVDETVTPHLAHTFVIPDGNYSYELLACVINDLVSNHALLFSEKYQMLMDEATGKMRFASKDETPFGLILWTTPSPSSVSSVSNKSTTGGDGDGIDPGKVTQTLGWMLGFRRGSCSGRAEHGADSLVDLSGSRYIYLVVDDGKINTNDFIIGNLHTSYLNENILGRITLINEKFQVINNNSTNIELKNTQTRFYPQPVKIDRLRIRVFDEYGKIVDLNGMDISLTLEFTLMSENIPFLLT
jgi:hypothetical protein